MTCPIGFVGIGWSHDLCGACVARVQPARPAHEWAATLPAAAPARHPARHFPRIFGRYGGRLGIGRHPRRYDKLLATEDYDVWLIAWAASGALELHDHGGSIGVVRVVAGELVETFSDLVDRHPLRSATIGAGQSVALPATRVHEVWNPGPAPALSLHIYSPPLASMTFYDDRPASFLVALRAECEVSPG